MPYPCVSQRSPPIISLAIVISKKVLPSLLLDRIPFPWLAWDYFFVQKSERFHPCELCWPKNALLCISQPPCFEILSIPPLLPNTVRCFIPKHHDNTEWRWGCLHFKITKTVSTIYRQTVQALSGRMFLPSKGPEKGYSLIIMFPNPKK